MIEGAPVNALDPSMVTFSTHGWSPLLVTGMSCVMVCRAGARKVKDVDTLAAVTYSTHIRSIGYTSDRR